MEDDIVLDTLPVNIDQRDVMLASTIGPVPAIIENAGGGAQFAYDEFLYGRLRNPYTRKNYQHAVGRFLQWAWHRRLMFSGPSS